MSLRLSGESWAVAASSGYIDLSGGGETVNVGLGDGELTVADADSVSGFADLSLSGQYSWAPAQRLWPFVTTTLTLKLPTGDEASGLSTGSTDVGLRSEISYGWDRLVAFASGGVRLRGDSETTDLRNSAQAGAGLQYLFSRRWTALVSYDFRGAPIELGEEAHEITALATWQAAKRLSLAGYVYRGFTDASPDIGVGLSLSWRWGGR